MCALNFPMFIFSSFSPHNYSEANTWRIQFAVKMAFKRSINRALSLTWSAAMQICLNKRQFLPYKKGSTPKGLVWGTEMAAVSWSWDNNMPWRRAKTLYYSWRKNRILTMENLFDSLLFDKLFACSNNNSVNNAKCAMKGVL